MAKSTLDVNFATAMLAPKNTKTSSAPASIVWCFLLRCQRTRRNRFSSVTRCRNCCGFDVGVLSMRKRYVCQKRTSGPNKASQNFCVSIFLAEGGGALLWSEKIKITFDSLLNLFLIYIFYFSSHFGNNPKRGFCGLCRTHCATFWLQRALGETLTHAGRIVVN